MGFRSGVARAFAAVLLLVCGCAAADLHEIEARLKQDYGGKTITLRRFYSASFLHYDSRGALRNRSDEGPWTVWSKVQVTGVSLHRDKLEISGTREFVRFHRHSDRPTTMELLHTDRSVSVRVDLDSATEDSVRAALRSVVAGSNEEFAALAPAHWQPFLRGETTTQNRHSPVDDKPQGGAMGDVDEPVRVNPAVAHTRLLREVKPAYPMIARQVRAKGAVMLRMVIGTDGRPKQVWIISPVGVGLDDAAVEAVRKWVYRPWVVDGRPLQVQTDVTVLYELKG